MSWTKQAEGLLSDVWSAVSTSNSTCSFIVSAVSTSNSTCSFSRMFEEMLLTVPLELVPDAVAWAAVQLLAVYLIRLVVVHRPKTFACAALAWVLWLGWRVTVVEGYEALEAAQERGTEALHATGEFTRTLVKLVRDWIHFFMPFMNDLCSWLAQGWRHTNLRQRLAIGCALLSMMAIYSIAALFWKHQQLVRKLLFHASFFVFGPLLWYVTALLPEDVLPLVVGHMITTLPSVLSFGVLSREYWRQAENARAQKMQKMEQPKKTWGWRSLFSRASPETSSSATQKRPRTASGPIPTSGVQMHRLWLSYWTCWPALRLLEVALHRVPQLIPSAGQNALQLQVELQRAMLIFVVWLMLWQGSRLLNMMLRSFFSQGIWESVAWFFGAQGLQGLIKTNGIIWAMASFSPLRLRGLVGAIMNRLWLMGFTFFILVLLLCCVVWTFYSALSVVSQSITGALWIFAALDTTDTVATRAEAFYTRKLAFWVLAMAWDVAASLPVAGVLLRIFTPIAFSVWLVAGDFVLRQLTVPILRLAATLSQGLASKAVEKISGRRVAAANVANTAEAEGDVDANEDADGDVDANEDANVDANEDADGHVDANEDAATDEHAGQDEEPQPVGDASESEKHVDETLTAQRAKLDEASTTDEVEKQASPKRSLGTKSSYKGDLPEPEGLVLGEDCPEVSQDCAAVDTAEEPEGAEDRKARSSTLEEGEVRRRVQEWQAPEEPKEKQATASSGRKSKTGTKKKRH